LEFCWQEKQSALDVVCYGTPPAKKIIENYGNLWYIERAFRMNKTDLHIRPVYHRIKNRIEGHIRICFTACTVLLETERNAEKTFARYISQMRAGISQDNVWLTCRLPNSRETHAKVLEMSDELRLFQVVGRRCR
jgi:transposase